jgi:DNA-binding NarL/FixJ family response regulator
MHSERSPGPPVFNVRTGDAYAAQHGVEGEQPKFSTGAAGLTTREEGVLRAVATGASNVEIGRRLGISGQTVKKHVSVLIQKLNVRNRVQLAVIVALTTAGAGRDHCDYEKRRARGERPRGV